MKNRLCILFLSIFMIFIMTTQSFASNALISDITDSNQKTAVEYLHSLGIVNGMSDGKYHPDQMVTREQLAKLIILSLGLEDEVKQAKTQTRFKDVSSDRWSAVYIHAAADRNIINGYPDGTFHPKKTVTYAEALTMIVRSLGFTDSLLNGTWPNNYITKATDLEITNHVQLAPNLGTDRGSTAVLIYNGLHADSIGLTLEQSINTALENSPAIIRAKWDLEQSEVTYKQTKSALRKQEDIIEEESGKDSVTYLDLITKNNLANEENWRIAQNSYKAAVEAEKTRIEETYFQVVHAQKALQIYDANIQLSKDLYEKSKLKFSLGTISQKDLLSSELNYTNAKKNFVNAENLLKRSKMTFNNILGYNVTNELILTDELTPKSFEEINIDEIISTALENRIDGMQVHLQHEIAKIEMEVATRRYAPNVYEYQQKEIALKKAEQIVSNTEKAIEMDIQNKYLAVLQKQNEISAAQKSVALAQKILDSTTLSYELGMVIFTDVQQAQIGLQTEQLGLAQSILDYNTAVLKFKGSLGPPLE